MDPIPLNPDASGSNGNQQDIDADNQLKDLFTDGSGIVRGVSSIRNLPGRDTHYQMADGTVHTFHVYADERASRPTNLYAPPGFSNITFISNSTVVATNPVTKEAINFFHVLKTAAKPPNALGCKYVGQTGGTGGERPGDMHAHGTLYKNRASRNLVESWRREPVAAGGFTRDISAEVAEHVIDIRSLI